MKRILNLILILLIFASFVLPLAAEAEKAPRLIDNAELFSDGDEKELLERLDSISEAYESDVVIITVPKINGYSAESAADDYYDSLGYGFGSEHDGMLLLISINDRDVAISTCGNGMSTLSDSRIDSFWDDMTSELSDGNYKNACEIFADNCEYYLDGDLNGFPFDTFGSIVISVIVGALAAFIVTGSWRSQLKSVRRNESAAGYVRDGSMNVTVSNDLFLYRNVSRTRRQQSSSGGSSSHRSSSGRTHGGRSGKF